ncbi:MAG: glycoside hydrolase family 13 protein [bacterium]
MVYQIYPRSFADSDGDGVGDLPGIRSRLPYLAELGVDGLWLSPFYLSPMADHGYDVADPTDVDPLFGTLADFDELVADAHALGIKVAVDIVPNHFSDQHEWFQQALTAEPGSPERERFIFRDGRGDSGELPPNNWPSAFGGPAWARVADGQWYLHIFAPEQPDVNWENPQISDEFARVLRFWLDRGADGFRMDVAHGMAKAEGLPDMATLPSALMVHLADDPRFDQPRVHDYLRGMRKVVDEYPGAMIVGEVWASDSERLARYVRPDELHLSFNFELVKADWSYAGLRSAIEDSITAMSDVGASCTWVLANHDVVRQATRYGGGDVGRRRARAGALIELSLPGAVYLYNGEELGLENVDLPDEALQDPAWLRSGHTERGRDGERIPVPWTGSEPPYGFTTGEPWLPMPDGWAEFTVEAESTDPDSTLSLYRAALRLRRSLPELHRPDFAWAEVAPQCLAVARGSSFLLLVNLGEVPVTLPGGEVLLASERIDGDQLPPDTAVWLRPA